MPISLTNPVAGDVGWAATVNGNFTNLQDKAVALDGRSGGQTIQGGTGASQDLSLESTADATKGFVVLKDTTKVDGASGELMKHVSTPGSVPSGYTAFYGKSDGKLYRFPSGGSETELGGGGGGATSPIGGTGVGGAVTYSGSTTVVGPINATTLTINGGVTISTSSLRAVHLKATGNFTNSGTIDADGDGFPGGAAGTGGSAPTSPAQNGLAAGGGGGGSYTSQAGAAGGDRADFFGSGGAGAAGGIGGAGGAASSTRPAWLTNGDIEGVSPRSLGMGNGGGGGGYQNFMGGAGGAGGGLVVVEARGNLTEGTINARGVAGGAGGFFAGGGGGGGGGGMVLVVHGGTRTAGSISVAAGSGGTATAGGGSGGAGEAGIVQRIQVAV